MKKNVDVRMIKNKSLNFISGRPLTDENDFSYLPCLMASSLRMSDFSLDTTSNYFSVSNASASYLLLPENSIAVKAASVIIEQVNFERPKAIKTSIFNNAFYKRCLDKAVFMVEHFEDEEFLLIFLKQLSMVLKNAGCIFVNQATICADVEMFYKFPEKILFESFWNYPLWRNLFPSMPELADKLQNERYLFVELLLQYNQVSVSQISEDFFVSAGVSDSSNLMAISFVDYSILSWFSRFSLINFKNSLGSPIVTLTSEGRLFLNSLDSFC